MYAYNYLTEAWKNRQSSGIHGRPSQRGKISENVIRSLKLS